jgi:CheY-like chemotaxis protein
MVKYIANSAAKNMSSEDSQTIVPTLTRFGRLVGDRGGIFVADAVATGSLLRHPVGERWATPRVGAADLRPAPGVGTIHSMKVVVYSHDADTRARVRLAIGRRPAPDVPDAEIIDVATEPALFRLLDAGGADVMVLDGEAQPAGGMGVCRQAKDEIHNCPPVLLIIGRPDDGWLATWSGADAVVSHPIDPRALASALAGLMRQRGAVAQA